MFTSMQQVIKPLMLLCQAADHVSVNCWLSRRSIYFSLLLSRTSSSSHPTAVTRLSVVRRSAWRLFQKILTFSSYHDRVTKCFSTRSSAFQLFIIVAFIYTVLQYESKLAVGTIFL